MAYTSGPLRIKGPSTEFSDEDGTIGGDYAIWDKHSKIIAETYQHVGCDDVRDAYANARLFANAADLLEACRALVEPHIRGLALYQTCTDGIGGEDHWFCVYCDATSNILSLFVHRHYCGILAARDAIASATERIS